MQNSKCKIEIIIDAGCLSSLFSKQCCGQGNYAYAEPNLLAPDPKRLITLYPDEFEYDGTYHLQYAIFRDKNHIGDYDGVLMTKNLECGARYKRHFNAWSVAYPSPILNVEIGEIYGIYPLTHRHPRKTNYLGVNESAYLSLCKG